MLVAIPVIISSWLPNAIVTACEPAVIVIAEPGLISSPEAVAIRIFAPLRSILLQALPRIRISPVVAFSSVVLMMKSVTVFGEPDAVADSPATNGPAIL